MDIAGNNLGIIYAAGISNNIHQGLFNESTCSNKQILVKNYFLYLKFINDTLIYTKIKIPTINLKFLTSP